MILEIKVETPVTAKSFTKKVPALVPSATPNFAVVPALK